MKTILIIVAFIIAYGIIRLVFFFVFGFVRVALKRRKIAKLDRLDRMDNGNRLRTYFLELDEIKQGILDKWPGQFPPGNEGKLVTTGLGFSHVHPAKSTGVSQRAGSAGLK